MTGVAWDKVKHFQLVMKPGPLWRLALDYVPGPRLLRIQVTDDRGVPADPDWGRKGHECKAYGLPTASLPKTALLCSSAPKGALIGKLGGSSADQPDITPNAPPNGSKKVFAVGSHCVIAVTKDDSGPLYLTQNEVLDAFAEDMGVLWILIEEATV